jgi:hypothetical protein
VRVKENSFYIMEIGMKENSRMINSKNKISKFYKESKILKKK